jgi:hypothetical protein
VAKRTVALLDQQSGLEAAFSAIFLTPSQPAAVFDYLWRVRLPEAQQQPQQPADTSSLRQQEQQVRHPAAASHGCRHALRAFGPAARRPHARTRTRTRTRAPP